MPDLLRISTLTSDTAITIATSEDSISLSVKDVLKWLAPTAPPHEALRFLLVCRSARVNPFLGEAHLVPMGDKWTVVIDKSGWLRRAEENPKYDGQESGIVVRRLGGSPKQAQGDAFDIVGSCLPPDHIVIGGWARVWRRDRKRPTTARVSLVEYGGGSPTWKRLTSTMLRKTALIHALRESGLCFGFSGAYDRDELPSIIPQEDSGPLPEEIEADYHATPMPSLSPHLAAELIRAIEEIGMTNEQVDSVLARRGVSNLVELTDQQAREIITKIRSYFTPKSDGQALLPDQEPPVESANPDPDLGTPDLSEPIVPDEIRPDPGQEEVR